MSFVRSFGKFLFQYLPDDNETLYRVCRKYVERRNGDNDDNMRTNGEMHLLRQALPGARTVFDVGANVGSWVRAALQVNSSADYHCFEPSRGAYLALVGADLPKNVRANNVGLSDESAERPLFIFGDRYGINSLYDRKGISAPVLREESIQLTTLDAYCERNQIDHVDFVKIDVEGHELAVLRGARRMLSEGRIDIIQFEYGGTYIDARVLLKDVWDYVQEVNLKYSFFKLRGNGPCPIPAYQRAFETFHYSNWVIRRS